MATQLTQASENFGYSRVRLRRIVKLQFGVVNPNELVRTGWFDFDFSWICCFALPCRPCCFSINLS